MPVRRDTETGEPVEEFSRKLNRDRDAPRRGRDNEPPTMLPGTAERNAPGTGALAVNNADDPEACTPLSAGSSSPFEAPTRPMPAKPRKGRGGGDQTRLLRPRSEGTATRIDDRMADPISGWLVVVAGPGKGEVCRLGYGRNSLGRAEESRVRLDFGDDRISREEHATVTYDPRGRKFYLQHGGGKNLTYLGDEPVLVPTVVDAMAEFSVGRTTLRFVPFCGPGFDWHDTDIG